MSRPPAEEAARANRPEVWDQLWASPDTTDWRGHVLAPVYDRIVELMPPGSRVVDVGGGVGMLAGRLKDAGHDVEVWDHSTEALRACARLGVRTRRVDLERDMLLSPWEEARAGAVVCTEVLEHLSSAVLAGLLDAMPRGAVGFFSVPNDRLGPDEEPQHARKWTALEFKRFLRSYFDHVRVEVLGPPAQLPAQAFPSDRGQPCYLLGVVGFPKAATVSMCMPARDEAADIERTLASFMGFADEIVVGVDPRTKDATRALAEKYADVVFDLIELLGPPGEEVPEGGFHFSHARNQCMARCTSDWIFMTEAHEHLWKGQDVLLHLDQLPEDVAVAHVVRTGGRAPNRQQWLFPWLCRNGRGFRYVRSTHNTLEFGDAPHVVVRQVQTLHDRVHERDVARAKQRAVQNRQKLEQDWLENHNEWSLHYLGAEWRAFDREKAIEYLHRYIEIGTAGILRYHTRLVLAKELHEAGRDREAKDVLLDATADDWTRTEHWVFLGDLAMREGQPEEALAYYRYAGTRRLAPLGAWWVDLAFYSWIPQQRLASVYLELGDVESSLVHARQVRADYDADEAPPEMIAEADENIRMLEVALHGPGTFVSVDQPATVTFVDEPYATS